MYGRIQERVIYNKEVQTMDIQTEPTPVDEDEIRERVLREREAAEAERLAHEQELEAESKKLDEEIAQEIRGQNPSDVRVSQGLPLTQVRYRNV